MERFVPGADRLTPMRLMDSLPSARELTLASLAGNDRVKENA